MKFLTKKRLINILNNFLRDEFFNEERLINILTNFLETTF